jgi:hypothetical protein
MGIFDDLLAKATEFTGIGQDAADAASQAAEDATSQVQDHIQGAAEQIPTDPQDVGDQLFGNNEQEK